MSHPANIDDRFEVLGKESGSRGWRSFGVYDTEPAAVNRLVGLHSHPAWSFDAMKVVRIFYDRDGMLYPREVVLYKERS